MDLTNYVPMRTSTTRYKGTSTKKGRRAPGSTIVPGTIQAPRKGKVKDRERATPKGTSLNWRKASLNVKGI